MIDPKLPGDRIINLAGIHGQWRELFDREDDADQVFDYVLSHIDRNYFEVERDGGDVIVRTLHVADSSGPDPLDDDSGYGPDSYFGRAMQKDD